MATLAPAVTALALRICQPIIKTNLPILDQALNFNLSDEKKKQKEKKKKGEKDQNPNRHIAAVGCYCGKDFHFI